MNTNTLRNKKNMPIKKNMPNNKHIISKSLQTKIRKLEQFNRTLVSRINSM